jgi:hypothetical protein
LSVIPPREAVALPEQQSSLFPFLRRRFPLRYLRRRHFDARRLRVSWLSIAASELQPSEVQERAASPWLAATRNHLTASTPLEADAGDAALPFSNKFKAFLSNSPCFLVTLGRLQ